VKRERAALVEKDYPGLSVRGQCELLDAPRSSVYYRKRERAATKPGSPSDTEICRMIDETVMIDPTAGSRRTTDVLRLHFGVAINRKRVIRLRRQMGIEAIYCRPKKTSLANAAHRKYPYLLRDLKIERPDQVWCADITYIPMPHGHAYLCAVMDWYSRRVLGWAVSNTMEVGLCLAALEMAVATAGCVPDIFNTDQGSQFTSEEWTGGGLKRLGIRISMDGRRRWLDNVFIERLWRSLKYEDVYVREYADVMALEAGIGHWFERYNTWRPHQALGSRLPALVHRPDQPVHWVNPQGKAA
jgi:putative transposase